MRPILPDQIRSGNPLASTHRAHSGDQRRLADLPAGSLPRLPLPAVTVTLQQRSSSVEKGRG